MCKSEKTQLIPFDSNRENLTFSQENSDGNLPNGFECPTCGNELYDVHPSDTFETCPAQKPVICVSCDFSDLRYISNE